MTAGPASLDELLTVRPQELASRRHDAVNAFLAERDLDPAWLSAHMRAQVGDGLLLLTSSPVHGLANATSDLDFIRVQHEPMDGPRISTKIFARGHHLEVVSFSEQEVRDNVARLAELAGRPPGEAVAGFRRWDARFEPRRKQTERIVNGITLGGEAPYLETLPALGILWSRGALHSALEQVAHLCLAEAAGELRGRVGYAYNVLLHLMDALLSVHGDVYTTRKWYVLRWTRFVGRGAWHGETQRAAGAALERLRTSLRGALSAGAELRLAGDYLALVREVASAIGVAERIEITAGLDDATQSHAYLPGASLLTRDGRGLLVAGGEPAPATLALDELPDVEPAHATALLRAIRSEVALVTIRYEEAAP